ncbi:MAG: hypothetical protein AABW67_01315 [Nanoarchaeota archaeon]
MSKKTKVSRHVEWCLKKAQEEIEECKKQGKREKHRGLIRVNPDFKLAERHLAKAEHYLSVTQYLVKGKISDVSMSTIFYAMYQCFLSIAIRFGYESSNQSCTISLIEFLKLEKKIDIDERFLRYFVYEGEGDDRNARIDESIIELRENYTYGTEVEADKSKIDFFIKECKELIDITKEIIYSDINEEEEKDVDEK